MADNLYGTLMKRFFVFLPFTGLLLCCSQAPDAPKETSTQALTAGVQVYTANCAACHQVDGSGVPNIQPALIDDDIVAGDPNLLIRAVLNGPAKVLPPGRPTYSNAMPAFSRLTDQQIADVLTYIRHDFGEQASAIDAQQVQVIRTQSGL